MRRRTVGHSRPVGTVQRTRLFDCPEEPQLGGIVWDDPQELERAYRIVGVEEVARPGRWNLLLERISWDQLLAGEGPLLFGLVPIRR